MSSMRDHLPLILEMRSNGFTLSQIARRLNELGCRTSAGYRVERMAVSYHLKRGLHSQPRDEYLRNPRRKTHCNNGHAYDAEYAGQQVCKQCRRVRIAAWRKKNLGITNPDFKWGAKK